MTIKAYTVTIAARVPSESGPHTLTEVGRLNGAYGLSFTERLNGATEAYVSFLPDNQDATVKEWLRSPSHEVWIWRDDALVFAGPTVVRQAQVSEAGIAFSLQCRDALQYLRRRNLEVGQTFTYRDVDQALIVKDLIDQVQAQPWSNYGIDTTAITATGILRDRTYDADTFHNVGKTIEALAAVDNGFDYRIGSVPAARELEIYYPSKGVDKSQQIVLDRSNMLNPAAAWLWGIEDYVSHAAAISPGPEGPLTATAQNDDVLSVFGRADIGASYQDVTNQATMDDHARRLADERRNVLYLPAPQVIVSGFSAGEIETGDTIGVDYDYGLGLESVTARVAAIATTVGDDGNETVGIELI